MKYLLNVILGEECKRNEFSYKIFYKHDFDYVSYDLSINKEF